LDEARSLNNLARDVLIEQARKSSGRIAELEAQVAAHDSRRERLRDALLETVDGVDACPEPTENIACRELRSFRKQVDALKEQVKDAERKGRRDAFEEVRVWAKYQIGYCPPGGVEWSAMRLVADKAAEMRDACKDGEGKP
jgi:hypothetical protein